ncbi:hypothetical protein ACLB6G_20545 [Zhengella sp. ZM62]|uniref:hypothetical protein n=1 Tax=Zhengella sedimenti TaxID=3390035 RepID=UPI003974A8F1
MPKYAVYAIATASWLLAEVDADSEEYAIQLALETGDLHKCLCHQCASEIELGDAYEEQVELLNPLPPRQNRSGER